MSEYEKTMISTSEARSWKKVTSGEAGYGDPLKVVGNTLYGINHMGHSIASSVNTDLHGLTFFTRPYMNLQTRNIRSKRRLSPLLTDVTTTIHYAVRMLLDPTLSGNMQNSRDHDLSSPLIDNKQAFIPIFTNLLTGLSGWPDEAMDLYVSTPGFMNEVYSLVDHLGSAYSAFDLTASFRNIEGDPINAILSTWLTYAKGVANGSLLPYPEMIASRTIDYQTRIYRILLDKSKRWIQKIACCGVATPTANPLGAAFNFNEDRPMVEDTNTQSIPFKCIGYDYNDPIIARDFNATVMLFNSYMRPGTRSNAMAKIPSSHLPYFNFRGYPYISFDMELEWYVDKDLYELVTERYQLNPETGVDRSHDYDAKRGEF